MITANFTRRALAMPFWLSLFLLPLTLSSQLPLAPLCTSKVYTIGKYEDFRSVFTSGSCMDQFGTGVNPGQYHCESVTHLRPAQSGGFVELEFDRDYRIGYPNDRFVTGRLIILNGGGAVALNSSNCNGGRIVSQADMVNNPNLLFDSYVDGSSYDQLRKHKITSTAPDGCLTVVVLLLSTDLATFPFTVAAVPAPNECDFICQYQINASVGPTCGRRIYAHEVLSACASPYDTARYAVSIAYPNTNFAKLYGPDSIGIDLVGKNLKITVTDRTKNNSCWGYIKIEDKMAPEVLCRDTTVNCFEFNGLPTAEELSNTQDNCGKYPAKITVVRENWTEADCDDPEIIGYYTRDIITRDVWGNSATCTQTITIEKLPVDSIACPRDTMIECCVSKVKDGRPNALLWDPKYADIDAQGYAHPKPIIDDFGNSVGLVDPLGLIDEGDTIFAWPTNVLCRLVIDYEDWVFPTCGSSYKIRRIWNFKDWCTGMADTCVQWIKIVDTSAPVVFFSKEFPPIQDVYVSPHECKAKVTLKWPTIYNDCTLKATKGNPLDALSKFKVLYEVVYPNPDKPENLVAHAGHISFGKTEEIFVPTTGFLFRDPFIQIKYTVFDPCGNSTSICQTVISTDRTPPIPVCDQHTQVVLDARSCWTRIAAKDLDDGSHDNCDDVHFAVARMEDITFWRNHWQIYLDTCTQFIGSFLGLTPADKQTYINKLIDEWIDLYVFEDYIDVNDCGTEQVVLRVYEAFDFPVYDAHRFKGSEHQWYNWFRAPLLRFGSYRCNYIYYYDSLTAGAKFYPPIQCDDITLSAGVEQIRSLIVRVLEQLGHFDFDALDMTLEGLLGGDIPLDSLDEYLTYFLTNSCENPLEELSLNGEGIFCLDMPSLLGEEILDELREEREIEILTGGLDVFTAGTIQKPAMNNTLLMVKSAKSPAPTRLELTNAGSLLLGYYAFLCYSNNPALKAKLFANLGKYPELFDFVTHEESLTNLLTSGILWKRFLANPYYNDCMVTVEKVDKNPPVCIVPDPVTVYCDGVPLQGTVLLRYNNSTSVYNWTGASGPTAQDVCVEGSDLLSSYCAAAVFSDKFCVEIPWNGVPHGYYGGPYAQLWQSGECRNDPGKIRLPYDEAWQPIYCRVWLLLDHYDRPGRLDPDDYLVDPEFTDNCSLDTFYVSKVDDLRNECGTGTVTKTWTAWDKCRNITTCSQRLEVLARSDYEVCFPADVIFYCELNNDLTPDGPASRPQVTDDDCEIIGISYEDEILPDAVTGCQAILRRWKVINWCVYDPDEVHRRPDVIVDDREIASAERPCVVRCLKDNGDGYMEYHQLIRILDLLPPTLDCPSDLTICSYSENCAPVQVNRILGSAIDRCTDLIRYRYSTSLVGGSETHNGLGNVFNGTLGYGTHMVRLIAEDRCGNADTCTYTITIRDCKPPTPFCDGTIITVIMQGSNSIQVSATLWNEKSFDNCTADNNLVFSFDSLGLQPTRIFTCADIPNGVSQNIAVKIWVRDEAGNRNSCIAMLNLQDGVGNLCPNVNPNPVTDRMDEVITGVKVPVSQEPGHQTDQVTIRDNGSLYSAISILHQNRPNPFGLTTTIAFELVQSGPASLRILDLNGRLIREYQGDWAKGYHEIKVQNLETKGVLYYQLHCGETVLTKKMIMLD